MLTGTLGPARVRVPRRRVPAPARIDMLERDAWRLHGFTAAVIDRTASGGVLTSPQITETDENTAITFDAMNAPGQLRT